VGRSPSERPRQNLSDSLRKTISVRRSTANRLLNLGRLVPLLVALCAVGTYCVWKFAPDVVTDLDKAIVARYVDEYEQRLETARAALQRDRAAGIVDLRKLLVDLAHHRKGDRLVGIAKQAARALSEAHAASGELEAAIAVLALFLRIDAKDLEVRADLFACEVRVPAKRSMAIARLREWHDRFPGSPLFAGLLARVLVEDGDHHGAWQVHRASFVRGQSNYWTVEWPRLDDTFDEDPVGGLVPRLDDGRLRLVFEIEPRAAWCRIRVPRFCFLEFRDLELQFERPNGVAQPASGIRFDGIHEENGVHRVVADAASIHIADLPATRQRLGFGAHEPTTIRLAARVAFLPSRSTARFAFRHRERLLAIAAERGDSSMAATVLDWASRAIADEPLALFWSAGDAGFDPPNRVARPLGGSATRQGREFRCSFPVVAEIRSLRVDLPGILGLRWRLTRVSVANGDQAVEVASVPARAVDLRADTGNPWHVVTGPDPYLVFRLPTAVRAERVTIEGEVR
jgi:hypothetical protein